MENLSKKRKLEVLTSSMPEGVPFGFPLCRRSHLKSETFSTLIRIFSLCVNESQAAQVLPIVSDAPNPGTQSEELEKVTQQEAQIEKLSTENDPITNQNVEVIGIEPSSSSLEKDISVHNVALLDRNYDNLGLSQTVVEESVQAAEEMEISQQSFSFEILEIDKQPNGEILEESKQVEHTQVPSLSLVQNVTDELANEIQQKETDLMKPVNMETDREIEDGEIPDDSWDTDLSFDMFLEDAALINEMKLGEDQIPGELTKRREFHDVSREQKQADMMHPVSTSYLVDTVEQKMSEGEFNKTRKLQQAYGDDFLLEARKNNKDGDETRGGFNFPLTYADSLRYPVKTSEKSMTENEGIVSTEMDFEVREKKRRGPRSKDYKANKKKKERKKRAEKERQQGVKRLRIQPIIKPKIVKYCEFYLNGRCQKGDACKFSHDTTPLTKSQPCKFLALQSCLKGDNCPFDHQLSKYPCNNYISKGYCHRGDACLFSHKVQPVESVSPSNISQTEPQSQPQPLPLSGITSTRKPQNSKNTSFQNPNNISKETTVRTPMSVGTGSQGHPEQNMSGRFKLPAQPPKGITFLSFGKSSLDESSNRQQGDMPCNKDKGVETSHPKDQNASEKPQSSNELLWKPPSNPLPLSQSSNPLPNWQNTNPTDSIQKRLLSTLSFAAKHESETMMGRSKCSPSLSPVEANKTPSNVAEATKTPRSGSSSSSVNVPKEWKNASPVLLEFLFGSGGNS